jgi:hypothetical protein
MAWHHLDCWIESGAACSACGHEVGPVEVELTKGAYVVAGIVGAFYASAALVVPALFGFWPLGVPLAAVTLRVVYRAVLRHIERS